MLLFAEDEDFREFPRYSDSFVAARPHSSLLEKALAMYIRISTSEPNVMAAEAQVLVLDNKTQAFGAP